MTAPDQPPPSRPTEPAPSTTSKQKRNVSIGQILAGLLIVLIVIFIVENTDKVKIRFIAGPKVETPVYLALLIAAVVGAVVAALLRYRRKRHHGDK